MDIEGGGIDDQATELVMELGRQAIHLVRETASDWQ